MQLYPSDEAMTEKYLLIITCDTIKAVHFEVLKQLTSQSIVLAYNRFTARRGCPILCSFNPSRAYLEGDKVTRNVVQHLPLSHLERSVRIDGTQWMVNSASPYLENLKSDVWEKQLMVICKHLRNALSNVLTLDEETFITVLARIESSVNARPLSQVDCSTGPRILTPRDVLIPCRPDMEPEDEVYKMRAHSCEEELAKVLTRIFWEGWSRDHLLILRDHHRKQGYKPELTIGDLVMRIEHQPADDTWYTGQVANFSEVFCVSTSASRPNRGPLRLVDLHSGDTGCRRLERHLIRLGSKYLPGTL